jgi:ATP-dependent 26S proteasome regulatory subunit
VRVSGPTLVGKYLSDGARMVHDMSRLAREKASSFVFIDEVDAMAAQRHRVREPTAR